MLDIFHYQLSIINGPTILRVLDPHHGLQAVGEAWGLRKDKRYDESVKNYLEARSLILR